MTIRHHPSTETLAAYAAGALETGPSIVVAAHLAGCGTCQDHVDDFEAVGGALLEMLPPSPVAVDALALTLAMIDAPEPAPAPQPPRVAPRYLPGGTPLPAALEGCKLGPWLWRAPGLRASVVRLPKAAKASVMLLRVGPNRKIPPHSHTGMEFTQILSGSYSDGANRYFPGDLVEANTGDDHQPVVDSGGDCICLIALEGRIRLHDFVGRLLHPFTGL